MAKSSRSSSRKENNRRKAATVFGPTEDARAERLSARLMELAKQPKPESSDVNMDENSNAAHQDQDAVASTTGADAAMEVDSKPSKSRIGKKRIDKRKQKKASIIFPKYSDRLAGRRKKKEANTA